MTALMVWWYVDSNFEASTQRMYTERTGCGQQNGDSKASQRRMRKPVLKNPKIAFATGLKQKIEYLSEGALSGIVCNQSVVHNVAYRCHNPMSASSEQRFSVRSCCLVSDVQGLKSRKKTQKPVNSCMGY